MANSTVIDDHLRFTIYDSRLLCPFQRALAPSVIIANNQNTDEYKHLDQRKLGKTEIVAHEDDGPRQQKDRLDIKDRKQHRDDVVAHRKARVRVRQRIDATLVRPHLSLLILNRP